MLFRCLTILFGAGALLAGACAGYMYFRPPIGPGLVVENPERVLTAMVVGRECEIDFRIVNRTNDTLKVVGGGFS